MNDLQKMGGVAALIEAATFVVGIALAFTILAPYATGDLDPGQTVAFLADNGAILYVWNLTIYVLFGVFLVVLVLALYERLKAGSPAMAQTASAFGLIWAGLVIASGMIFSIGLGTVVDLYVEDPAQAASVWLAIASVQDGLGGGIEVVGGLWVLAGKLGGLAGRRASQGTELPRHGARCVGPPHGCPGRRGARGRFWAGSHRVVRMAWDRHVARQPKLTH